jgi:iron-regulated transporter 1
MSFLFFPESLCKAKKETTDNFPTFPPLCARKMVDDKGAARRLLVAMTGLRSVGDRSWGFILPMFLATVEPGSLAPTAVLSAVQTVFAVAFAPMVASWFDTGNRETVFLSLMLVENVAVVIGGALLLFAGMAAIENSVGGLINDPMFWLGLVFMGIDSVCSSVLEVIISKDWVTALCHVETGKKNSDQVEEALLRTTNGSITRTDLGTSILSYMVLGHLIEPGTDGVMTMVILLCAWHVMVAAMMGAIVRQLCSLAPVLRQNPGGSSSTNVSNKKDNGNSFLRGWSAFLKLGYLPRMMMTGYILVWLTVLSPSGVLTAWLTSTGVKPATLANFRAASQASGALGTIVAPHAIRKLGVMRAGFYSLSLQLICVLTAVLSVSTSTTETDNAEIDATAVTGTGASAMMLAVIASRVGLWGFDLAERQVVQQAAQREDRAMLFNWERAVCNATYLVIVGLSMVFPSPSEFWVLVWVSASAIAAAFLVVGKATQWGHSSPSSPQSPPRTPGWGRTRILVAALFLVAAAFISVNTTTAL